MFENLTANINPWIVLLASFIIVACLYISTRESFTDSGLPMSKEYCTKLADVYYRPGDVEHRDEYRNKICGEIRRSTVDQSTGNYYTEGGIIV